jgi:hypothetical protein
MYPWDSRADGPRTRPPALPAPRHDSDAALDPATQAVQAALDLRDNGGETATAGHARQ